MENQVKIENTNSTNHVPLPPVNYKVGTSTKQIDSKEVPTFKKTDYFTGLVNQGLTCYLNSLLQSLFMTPEFRLNLLNWRFDIAAHGAKPDCIPYQLQKLFARLQLKIRNFEDTKDLTGSFQWGHSEVYTQHDIQELCRVLFEAIECSLGPNDENFTKNLYEGNLCSVVECCECNNRSERKATFLDLTLPIRNDFEKIYNSSLNQALYNYLKPEKLCDDNKYFCEVNCNKKVDALKYVKFESLPKILFIALSRFEYDLISNSKKKINDKVTFPLLLNMNNFMKESSKIAFDKDQVEKFDEELLVNEKLYKEKLDKFKSEGEFVYELFSVVIHSGNANGGHYFAYIKSFVDRKWYSFNDKNVCELCANDIGSVFGGKSSFSLSNNYSSTTGYILIYRKVTDNEPNFQKLLTDDLIKTNEQLHKEILQENEKFLEEERKWKEKLYSITLQVIYKGEKQSLTMKKTDKMRQMKAEMMKIYGLTEKGVSPEDVKVRAYNHYSFKPQEYFDDEESTLEENSIIGYRYYTIELRDSQTGKFEEYDPNLITLVVFPWQEENADKSEEYQFYYREILINKLETITKMFEKIKREFNFEKDDQLFIFKKVDYPNNNFNFITLKTEDMNKQIFLCAIMENTKLFVEKMPPGQNAEHFESKFVELMSLKLADSVVKFNIPYQNDASPKYTKFDKELKVKKFHKMKEIKARVAEVLRMDVVSFKIRKNGPHGPEIKNMEESLSDVISSTALSSVNIYVELGRPLTEKEAFINLNLCEYNFEVFKLFPFKFKEVNKNFLINTDWKISEMKSKCVREIESKLGLHLDEEFVLLRESRTERPTRIFQDEDLIKDLDFVDHKKILVHEYKKEKLQVKQDEIQLFIRHWDRVNWNLSEPVELLISRHTNIEDLTKKLAKHFPQLEEENLSATRIVNDHNTFMEDVLSFKFTNLRENFGNKLVHYPFFLSSHGNMLIVQDESQPLREPTDDEKKFYCKPIDSSCAALALVGSTTSERINERKANPQTSDKISQMISRLGQSGANDHRSGIRSAYKEKGIVIKVKKNEVANSSGPEKNPTTGQAETSKNDVVVSDLPNEEASREKLGNFDIKDYVIENEYDEDFGPII